VLQVRVLWFGRPTRSPFEKLVQDYRKRVSRRWQAEDCAARPGARSATVDRQRALSEEAHTVLDRQPDSWDLIALDERGTQKSSPAFAALLEGLEQGPRQGVVFVIGSDLGLHQSIRDRATNLISLSRMTLPHLLARLILWEQLFRATDILGPGNYHRT
jgi:23S rRNA (pseudouridine1915-N3)-methyltransferase